MSFFLRLYIYTMVRVVLTEINFLPMCMYDGAGVNGRKKSAVFLENDRKKSTIFPKTAVFFSAVHTCPTVSGPYVWTLRFTGPIKSCVKIHQNLRLACIFKNAV